MSITDIRISSWDELIKELHSHQMIPFRPNEGNHYRSPFVFRGLAYVSWRLETSLERLGSPPDKVDRSALRAFRKYAPLDTFKRDSEWEVLAVAQHNGLPTLVLDWTVSPLVAVHFATAERNHWNTDGVIWCIDATALRDNFLPSSMLKRLRREYAWVFDVRMLDSIFPRLDDFDVTDQTDGDVLMFFEPPSIDARIENQFGILSAMNGSSKSHDACLRQYSNQIPGLVKRIIIDHRAKSVIRDMLDQNNITERMLFPGLPGLCDWLKRYYSPT